MATQEQIVVELKKAQDTIGSAIAMVNETQFPSDEIIVKNGDNLLNLIQDNQEDSIFNLDADFVQDVGQCIIPKPCTIKSPGTAKLVNASIDARPRDVKFFGIVMDGHKEVTILITGPRTFVEDCTLNGSPLTQHRGILCNTEGCRILSTRILNIFMSNDTQAIAGFAGTKDLIVSDCELEASGENIMFGGDTTPSDDAIPNGILIRNSHLFKNPSWRADTNAGCKNLFELKECRNLLMEGCNLEYSFVDGQIGYGIVLSVRNQYGRSPWATIQNITIQDNNLSHMAGGLSILGRDDTVKNGVRYPSVTMNNVLVRKNNFTDIDPSKYGNNGRTVFVSGGPINLSLEENYFDGANLSQAMIFDRCGDPYLEKSENLRVIKNRFVEGYYGMMAQDGPGLGEVAINFAAPGYNWTENVVKKSGFRNIKWPTSTIFEQ